MVLDAGTRHSDNSAWAERRREFLERSGRKLPKPIRLTPESHELVIPREQTERRKYQSYRSKPKKVQKITTRKPFRINHVSEDSFNSYKEGNENFKTSAPAKRPDFAKSRGKLPKAASISSSYTNPSKTDEFGEEPRRNEDTKPFKWSQSDIQRKVEESAFRRKSKEKSTFQPKSDEKSSIQSELEQKSTVDGRKSSMISTLKLKSEEKSAIISKLKAESTVQRKSRRRPAIQTESEEPEVQLGRRLTNYEESFGKGDNLGDAVRRKERKAKPAPPPAADATPKPTPAPPRELEKDELIADPAVVKDNMTGLGYPEEVIPGLTCLTEDDVKKQIKLMNSHYGKAKCPRKLPCRKFTSCLYFKSGLLTKAFGINMAVAKNYYNDVFKDLHNEKKKEIIANFEECVAYYSLEQPFVGSIRAEGAPSTAMPETNHTHKPKLKRQVVETTTVIPLLSSAEKLDLKPEPSGDCFSRIQDFTECKEIVELKGTCYWPRKEKT